MRVLRILGGVRSFLCLCLLLFGACKTPNSQTVAPVKHDFLWSNATVYFVLTDRFANGDKSNDFAFDRKQDGAVLRSYMGGDLKGLTQKIEAGYFDALGVNALWMTPVIEQIRGFTDEGTGKTYAYHGYWARDWTQIDPNLGSEEDFANLVATAHAHGIRILMDVVINHTGPVTATDSQWPDEWVRISPTCAYTDYASTVECTLVENLPDIHTESDKPVELPAFLVEKWKQEGRLDQQLSELDAFFEETGYPRAPRFYIIKWLTDWVRKYGIDGYRVDTAKHTEASIWAELKAEADKALAAWRRKHPAEKLDDLPFFMTGEVYNYFIDGGRDFDYGDKKVDFFNYGFESLINFSFKEDAKKPYEFVFRKYSQFLQDEEMAGLSVLNYLSSHDDGSPYDPTREKAWEAATKLLLSPGAAQIYYGDESARPLKVEGANGDANLRSMMNWEDLKDNSERQALLAHWQRLGRFRRAHLSVGAGVHASMRTEPYIFKRSYESNQHKDEVLVAMGLEPGLSRQQIPVFGTFEDGQEVKDYYSGTSGIVIDQKITIETPYTLLLLGVE